MSWLWRIIAALAAFLLASVTAYVQHAPGDAVVWVWRLAGVGLILCAALAGVILLVSGLVVLADARAAPRP